MAGFGGQAGGVHAEGVDAGVGEEFAAEAGEVAVHGAEEGGGRREEGEVPGQERFGDVGELVEGAGGGVGGGGGGELHFLGGGEWEGA